jgi:phosphatidylglycerophosphatase A
MIASPKDPDRRHSERAPLIPRLIASGCFVGYLPWASGTFGSLFGALLYLIPGFENPLLLGGAIAAGLAVGVPSAAVIARIEGNRLTRSAEAAKATFQQNGHSSPDPSSVVIDEIVGMWITMLLLPKSLLILAIGFVLFRIMDILKPEPSRYLERFPNGWGIMLDDVVAGIYANLLLQLVVIGLRQFAPSLL